MRRQIPLLAMGFLLGTTACHVQVKTDNDLPIAGTWRLFKAWSIRGKDTTSTEYGKARAQIKIINDDHFAFFAHDVNPSKDSSNHFESGGGSYTLNGDKYVEHLEYCGDPKWEDQTFSFTVSITNDTLTQQGLEKVPGTTVDHIIIEKYARVSPKVSH